MTVYYVGVKEELEHSRSRTTMWVQFDYAISYATGKLEIQCFEQTLKLAVQVILNQTCI